MSVVIESTDRLWSYQLRAEIELPQPLDEVFAFFADPNNLEHITPQFLNFAILKVPDEPLRDGARITYRISLHGLPMCWHTRIENWEPPLRFVDRQLFGPFLTWRHEHRFATTEKGTLVTDCVDYIVPGGALLHRLFIRRDLEKIFSYRHDMLAELFGANSAPCG